MLEQTASRSRFVCSCSQAHGRDSKTSLY